MKKVAAFLVIFIGLGVLPQSADAYTLPIYETAKPVTVTADGAYVPTDVDPYIERGRTLMPLRAGADAIGATVAWHSHAKKAVITKGNNKLVFILQQKYFIKNGQRLALDVPLQIKKGRIMLPLRAFAEALDVQVNWDKSTATVFVFTGGPLAASPDKSPLPQAVHWLIDKYYTADTSGGTLAGSWWHNSKREEVNSSTCLFFYKMPNGAYRGIELVYEQMDNGLTATEVSELVPSTFGMGRIPQNERGFIFWKDWMSLYGKVTPRGHIGDHYSNFKLAEDGSLCRSYYMVDIGSDLSIFDEKTYYHAF